MTFQLSRPFAEFFRGQSFFGLPRLFSFDLARFSDSFAQCRFSRKGSVVIAVKVGQIERKIATLPCKINNVEFIAIFFSDGIQVDEALDGGVGALGGHDGTDGAPT